MAINKNTQYVTSLIDFIKDTKPYHCKLSEVVEEYHFFDEFNVRITDSIFSKIKFDAVWPYSFNSSGGVGDNRFLAQRVVQPAFSGHTKNSDEESRGSHKAFRDENGDMANTPSKIVVGGIKRDQTIFAYNKESFDNVGINDAFVERNGDPEKAQPLLEGHDFFQSHGAYTFRIRQTFNASGKFVPLYAPTFDDNVVAESVLTIQRLALDLKNPASSVNVITKILTEIKTQVSAAPVRAELATMFDTLAIPDLPRSYANLFAEIRKGNFLTAEKITAFALRLGNASPSLYFNGYSDFGLRQSGQLFYDSKQNTSLSVFNIRTDPYSDTFEEWAITCIAVTEANEYHYSVVGSRSGNMGTFTAGNEFVSRKISFNNKILSTPLVGTVLLITPRNSIVVDEYAPRETWNLIKVNPLAYTRPLFVSERFGHLVNILGEVGAITVVDKTIKEGHYLLTAQSTIKFVLTREGDPGYTKTLTVGVPFNDGQIAFTIISGTTYPFVIGDQFILSITNIPASAEDLRLGYGYDLDAYDDQRLPYNTSEVPEIPLGFFYDTRYPKYDVGTVKLKVQDYAIDGRKWRMVAIPGPIHITDVATFDAPPGPRPASLKLYYAAGFKVEYSDDDFVSSIVDLTPPGGLQVGVLFSSVVHGVEFTIQSGGKPFIGAISDSPGFPKVIGGDVFSFTVRNPDPDVDGGGLNSKNIPRLIMHGDSFHDADASAWVVDITTPTAFTVTENNKIFTRREESTDVGMSYKDSSVHFTIVGGRHGLVEGEKFTFKTHAKKPTYLVHGSVSGWQPDAVVGEYYTNGKISFKIDFPTPVLYTMVGTPVVVPTYRPNTWAVNKKNIVLSRLRSDTPSLTYLLERQCSGYMVTRSDVGVIGHAPFDEFFTDAYITIVIPDVMMQTLKIDINGSAFPLWNAHDVLIVRPKAGARYPTANDFVLIEKTRNGRADIALTDTTSDHIHRLLLKDIDDNFIPEHSEEVQLQAPETIPRTGFLPMFSRPMDVTDSIAQYSDVTTHHVYTTAATNEPIGTLRATTANLDEPVIFEWDKEFLLKYLTANTETAIITTGTGWSEKVDVHLTESIKFLMRYGNSQEDSLFFDEVEVEVDDGGDDPVNPDNPVDPDPDPPIDPDDPDNPYGSFKIKITSNYKEEIDVEVEDTKEIRAKNSPQGEADTDIEEVTVLLNRGPADGYDNPIYSRGGYDASSEEKITFLTKKYRPVNLTTLAGVAYDDYITDYYIFGLARVIEVVFKEAPSTVPTFNLWLPGEPTFTRVRVVDRLSPTTFSFSIANASLGKIIIS